MQRDRWRFSVRRLVIGVAIVAALLGVSVVMRDRAREVSSQSQCWDNLQQIGLGLIAYEQAKGIYPSGTFPNASLPPENRLSWYCSIIPYLNINMYTNIAKPDPWDSNANMPFACTGIPILRDSTDSGRPTPSGPVPTPYVGIAGLGVDAPTFPKSDRRAGVFGYDRATKSRDITDGLATTMMVAETWGARGSWLAGGPATVRGLDPARQPYIGPGRQFGGLHRGGVNLLFADGSVRTLSPTIDPRVLEALSTIAGGETVPQDWDR
jgi:prepilin-type processing-associated H-X9-DG protein